MGLILLLAGMPMYFKYSLRKEIAELKAVLLSPEAVMRRASRQEEKFLANVLRHIKHFYRRLRRQEKPTDK